jgi:hypothetical protein
LAGNCSISLGLTKIFVPRYKWVWWLAGGLLPYLYLGTIRTPSWRSKSVPEFKLVKITCTPTPLIEPSQIQLALNNNCSVVSCVMVMSDNQIFFDRADFYFWQDWHQHSLHKTQCQSLSTLCIEYHTVSFLPLTWPKLEKLVGKEIYHMVIHISFLRLLINATRYVYIMRSAPRAHHNAQRNMQQATSKFPCSKGGASCADHHGQLTNHLLTVPILLTNWIKPS